MCQAQGAARQSKHTAKPPCMCRGHLISCTSFSFPPISRPTTNPFNHKPLTPHMLPQAQCRNHGVVAKGSRTPHQTTATHQACMPTQAAMPVNNATDLPVWARNRQHHSRQPCPRSHINHAERGSPPPPSKLRLGCAGCGAVALDHWQQREGVLYVSAPGLSAVTDCCGMQRVFASEVWQEKGSLCGGRASIKAGNACRAVVHT